MHGAPKNELRILMLEDTETDAALIAHELFHAGISFNVRRVERREAFIRALEEFKPDIIISDYHLPDIDGKEALKIATERLPDVPVVMVTGALPDIEAVELLHAGAKDYVLKDRLARLAPAVERVLEEAQDERERRQAEAHIRESEKRFRSLFNNMLEGYARCRMIYDSGRPVDFIYLEVNPAFEKLTGLQNVVNRKASELIPGLDKSNPELLDAYGRVARNGGVEKFEAYLPQLNKWFAIGIYHAGEDSFNAVFDNITERKRAEEKIINLTQLYATLSSTNTTIVRARSREELFDNICRGAVDLGKFALAWVGIVNEKTHLVEPVMSYGEGTDYLNDIARIGISIDDVPIGRGPTGMAIRENRVCFIDDYSSDARVEPWRDGVLRHGFHSAAAIPICLAGKPIGTLTLYSKRVNYFNESQLNLLDEMKGDISFALDNLEHEAMRRRAEQQREVALGKLQTALEGSIQMAASITEMRDPYTSGHQRRVAKLAAAIAQKMELSEDRIKGIHFAAIVHDIGKIAIPAEILSKPSRLSEIEYSLIKTHPQTGYNILKDIDFPWPIAQAVGQHHERLDGSGYPEGLTEKDILLEAKIIAVADVVEAIYSHRPYRPGLGLDAALMEIGEGRATRYDAAVVDACVGLIRSDGHDLLAG